jgi:hypothetical protein
MIYETSILKIRGMIYETSMPKIAGMIYETSIPNITGMERNSIYLAVARKIS